MSVAIIPFPVVITLPLLLSPYLYQSFQAGSPCLPLPSVIPAKAGIQTYKKSLILTLSQEFSTDSHYTSSFSRIKELDSRLGCYNKGEPASTRKVGTMEYEDNKFTLYHFPALSFQHLSLLLYLKKKNC
jgi:hypothetical protein